jgi:tripartite-type tricarboxylate transporter receptor subunit TctC
MDLVMRNSVCSSTVTIALFALLIAGDASAQTYPSRPVRLVSGYAPGGTTSIVGRLIGQKLTESWGQQFILDNRPGGGTLIAAEIVAKSPPDGYTLMLVDGAHVLAPLLLKAPYDPSKDFAPVATIAITELVLLLHPSVPSNNLAEFLTYTKSRPGKLNYATPAIGGGQHLAIEIFNSSAGIQLQHVPYKGAGPALVALISGEADMYFATTATGTPHVKAGKVKALAITGKKRSPLLPDVPTFDEAGLANFYNQKRPEYGIVAPAGTPKAVIDKLSAEVAKYLPQPAFRDALINLGLDPNLSTPMEYADALKANMTWNINTINVLRKKGVKFDS